MSFELEEVDAVSALFRQEWGTRLRVAAEAAAAAVELAAASSSGDAGPVPARSRASQTWAMLIKRVYEIDPLACPCCGGQMKVIAFMEPPQSDVIEKILRHCGLWCPSSPRAPPAEDGWVHDPGGDADSHWPSAEHRELTFVDEATFWATFSWPTPVGPRTVRALCAIQS